MNFTITQIFYVFQTSDTLPNTLQVGDLQIYPLSQCQSDMSNTGGSVTERNVCGKGDGVAACNGDSGGPLVFYVGVVPYIIGITSWGRSGCPTNSPSIFTNAFYYYQYIKDKTGII